ncbi:hypothetical protein, partial [Neptunitalea chrysea]|uniref:hypothetical protein n=1 Tax=Neptunitalea chrysea TaxID=1647581 RepID=UPI002490F0F6
MKLNTSFKTSLKSIAFVGLWITCAGAKAQSTIPGTDDYLKHEVALTAGGLHATIDYDMPETDIKSGRDLSFGFEYTYRFNKNFGISIGAEYQGYNATATVQQISGAYNTTDYEQESFEFRYNAINLVEEQQMSFINIPLLFSYENQEYGFYIKAGAKVGMPVITKYSVNYNLETSGYYQQYNVELFDPEFMGFGSFTGLSDKGTHIDLKTNIIGSFEFGSKIPLANNHNLYGGLFIDYGLTNIKKEDNYNPVNYTLYKDGAGFKNESVINSNAIKEVKTMAFGIK